MSFVGVSGLAIKIQTMTRDERNARTVAGIRTAAGAGAPRDPYMQVKKHAALIATDMALIHGGDWRVQIDHEDGLVLIARRRPATTTSISDIAWSSSSLSTP
jgi:hypothetical protein